MSLFGSLHTNYMPSPLPAGRLPTVPDGTSGDNVGNGGNAFLALVDDTTASGGTSDGKLSMHSALSPQLAYRASLIGTMLDDVAKGVPVPAAPPSTDVAPDPVVEVVAGSTVSFDAEGRGNATDQPNEATADADKTLPRWDADVRPPTEGNDGTFTNSLPVVDAPVV